MTEENKKPEKKGGKKAERGPENTGPSTAMKDPIAAAKAGPEPQTLREAVQEFLDKISFVCNKGAPGDVHAIRQELERFHALDHGIMREYCVPVHPEVEKHFKALRAKK
jgi:hypothetical protein